MSWICSQCLETLGDYNGWCEYCKQENGILVYNPDKYYIRDIRIRHIIIGAAKLMTPQEELFSQLFNHEKLLVKDMDTLSLRAHREELSKIAFEARARLTAVDDEDNDRKKKRSNGEAKPSGFERSLNIDETTTNAINTLKEKQKRLSKADKIREGLEKLGIASDAVDKIMSAKNMLSQVQKTQNHTKPAEEPKEAKPVFNPFGKKE
jgi:hypothetical protein